MWKKLKNKIDKFCGICVESKDILHNAMNDEYMDDKFHAVDEKRLKELNREKLVAIARGFTQEDWEIIIGEAPIDICHDRIGRRLREAAEFEEKTRDMFKVFNGNM